MAITAALDVILRMNSVSGKCNASHPSAPSHQRVRSTCPAAVRDTATPTELIRFQHVRYTPPGSQSPILRDVSFTLPHIGLALLVGRSGCGKTTLLSLLAGLSEPTHGCLSLDASPEQRSSGEQHTPAHERLRRVGCVFQFPERHFLGATLAQELTFGWPPDEAPPRRATRVAAARTVLAACGLDDLPFGSRLTALSGGLQRRVALAVQLCRAPDVLLLDEPLAGLDWRARSALVPLIARVSRRTCVLASTHDTQLLAPLASAGVWRVEDGRVIRQS